MTPERYRQIRNLFEAVVERPPEGRTAFLAEACAGDEGLRLEIEGLLAAHARDTGLPNPPAVPTWNPQRLEGHQVGPYEILREIGHGGMGTVYLAARADRAFHKQVALKVVRPEAGSEEMLLRFQQEREILATLDHPNIARLRDGGSTTEGLPYYVMEYVAGEPIDTYCDRHKLNVAQRLELFRIVCGAVSYAHRNGVVHRDLKPGNILVTAEGTPKLLDFGIAKILRAPEGETVLMTRSGLHLMTPEYASPEQVRGEAVTALTDIYSLGAILYELLTGHRPYRMRSRVFHEIVRVICEEPPTRPSTAVTRRDEISQKTGQKPITVTPEMISRARDASPDELRRQLSGDLDNILLKSLSKEPLARYRSADQFSEDVQRHLALQPVLARGDTWVYRFGKFLQHYRIWVIGTIALATAVATGQVTVRPIGLLYVAGAFALFGLWYAATDKKIGTRIAESGLFGFPNLKIALAVLVFFILIAPARLSYLATLFVAFLSIAIGFTRGIAWLTRPRWTGQLLLDLSRPRRMALNVAVVMYSATVIIGIATGTLSIHDDFLFLWLVFWSIWLVDGRLEVREQGIVHEGRLLRWGKIESYEWTEDERGMRLGLLHPAVRLPILHLHLRRLVKILPPFAISVPPEKGEALEALLSRYLSDWPG